MDFGTAVKNWRDPNHRAGAPRFRKRNRTGAGSFRAASGVVQIRPDGKRRVRLPRIGSVKLAHTLPQGILFEAHIKKQARALVSEPEVLEGTRSVADTGQSHTSGRS